MPQEPLYEDETLRIEYHPQSSVDHILYVKKDGDEFGLHIPRGILKDMAHTKRGMLEEKISPFNRYFVSDVVDAGVSVDGLHVALCQAHIAEEERYRNVSL